MFRIYYLTRLLLLCAAAAARASATAALELTINTTTSEFNIAVDGKLWLRGAAPTAGSNWVTNNTGPPLSLLLQKYTQSTNTHPTLGSYNETRFFWAASAARSAPPHPGTSSAEASPPIAIETAFKVFAEKEMLLFEYVVLLVILRHLCRLLKISGRRREREREREREVGAGGGSWPPTSTQGICVA